MTAEQLKSENLTTWLELRALEHGTPNQHERWLAKMLPEDELTALARTELFHGFDKYKRWKNIGDAAAERDVRHTPVCDNDDMPPTYVFETKPTHDMTHDQWEQMKLIQATAEAITKLHPWCIDGGCTVRMTPRAHVAKCARCARSVSYPTALVTVEWAGRTLTREYSL